MNPDPQPTPPPADWAMARNLRLARRLDGYAWIPPMAVA